ncbi:hypothetical protein ARMGADRAFT_1028277 [Armillaria gallica]|uniref:Uncharacterized protein n=1 Tax=Armillaria gallica TaxID=47427 RepID=A0A2H3E8T6_ARMGA|nr:hypothetical protein ARMGADRAFT_1028277 [Armillaria gallica]
MTSGHPYNAEESKKCSRSPLAPRGISIIRTRTFLPPPLMMDPRPSHVLSSISSKLQRDTFIWSNTYPSHLIIGINQRVTPVSSGLIKRWTQDIMQASWKEFHLCPVEVSSCGVLTYGILPTGPEIPMLSTDALPPGDYGWYFAEPKKKSPILMGAHRILRLRLRAYSIYTKVSVQLSPLMFELVF